jgi:hypothetical protein
MIDLNDFAFLRRLSNMADFPRRHAQPASTRRA